MATGEEIVEAYAQWMARCNANERLKRMLKGWDRVVHLLVVDSGDTFTVEVHAGQLSELTVGRAGSPDLIVSATNEDFADMFWGDLNPSEKYVSGEIVLKGSPEDVMRIDAMSMIAFLET